MRTYHSQTLADGIIRLHIAVDSRPATMGEVLEWWQSDEAFQGAFNMTLAHLPFAAFRWELPAITADTLGQRFECVVLNDPGLARRPNPEEFTEHFRNGCEVVAFPNLGGDAILVVPRPIAKHGAYGHLAAFTREAPETQQNALWQAVGEAMAQRVGAKPVWLSTAGAGVPWLHVRLDDRPKYYGHEPYRRKPG